MSTVLQIGYGGVNGPGFSAVRTFADVSAVTAYDATSDDDGLVVYVKSFADFFVLRTSSATVDGVTVLTATGNSSRRYMRALIPHPKWLTQATWELDPVSGNDANDGATTGTPIKTLAELDRRLLTGKVTVASTLSIRNGDVPSTDPWNCKFTIADGRVFTVVGATPTVSRSGSVTAYTAHTGNGHELFTDTGMGAGTWTTDITRRIKLTSGTHINKVTFPAKDLGSNQARIGQFVSQPTSFASGATGVPTVGNTYNIEVLQAISMGRNGVNQEISGNGAVAFPCLIFKDLDFRQGNGAHVCYLNAGDASVVFTGCIFRGQFQNIGANGNGIHATGCLLVGGAFIDTMSGVTFVSSCVVKASFQAVGASRIQIGKQTICSGAGVIVGATCSFQIGQLGISDAVVSGTVNPSGDGLVVGGNAQGEGATAVMMTTLGVSSHELWGAGNAGAGVRVSGKSSLVYVTTVPTISGSGGDFRCGQTALNLKDIDPTTGLLTVGIDQTWANFTTARPGGFGNNVWNPVNLASIVRRV